MRFLNDWLLTILLLVPAVGGAVVPFVRPARAVRRTAIGVALATFCVSLLILIPFHRQQGTSYDYAPAGTVQMLRAIEILPSLHTGYRVAIDGLSLPFVVLTAFIGSACAIASPEGVERPRLYFATFLWLEAATLGAFVAFDLLLLWAFVAAMLVPCCALVWMTAGAARSRAVNGLLVPMLVATACLFVAVMGERLMSTHCLAGGTLDLVRLTASRAGATAKPLFWLALIGFVIRLPALPFHSWLTRVATETPPAVAAAIGTLIPLTGGYGLLRVVLPLFPEAAASLWWAMMVWGLVTVYYHALAAIGQPGLSRAAVHLVVAMAGFVLIGAATFTPLGTNGAAFTLMAGGLAAGALFLLAGSADEAAVIGVASRSGSAWAGAFVAGMLALLTVPGLIGQTVVLLGTFQAAGRDSFLPRSPVAPAGAFLLFAAAMCVATLLFGLACSRTMNALAREDGPQAAPRSAVQTPSSMGVLVSLIAATILLGVLAGPFCFAFTRRAIAVLLGMPA